jgi:hypothetical protein
MAFPFRERFSVASPDQRGRGRTACFDSSDNAFEKDQAFVEKYLDALVATGLPEK